MTLASTASNPNLDQVPGILVGRLLQRGVVVLSAAIDRWQGQLGVGVHFSVAPATLEERFGSMAVEIARPVADYLRMYPQLAGLYLSAESYAGGMTFPHRWAWAPAALVTRWSLGELDDAGLLADLEPASPAAFDSRSAAWSTWRFRDGGGSARVPLVHRVPELLQGKLFECGLVLDTASILLDDDGHLALHAQFPDQDEVPAKMLSVARCAAEFLRDLPCLTRLTIWTEPDEPVAIPPVHLAATDVLAWSAGDLSDADLLASAGHHRAGPPRS